MTSIAMPAQLTHAQLTPEGRKYVENKLNASTTRQEQLEHELFQARQRTSYLISVMLCHHSIDQVEDGTYQCSRCKFKWLPWEM